MIYISGKQEPGIEDLRDDEFSSSIAYGNNGFIFIAFYSVKTS